MARCLVGAPYGCGHTEEHRRAAIKGWRSRREGRILREEAASFEHLMQGERVYDVHQEKGKVHFELGGKWYEVSRSEFRQFAREGRKIFHAEIRKQYREHQKATRDYEARGGDKALREIQRIEYPKVIKHLRGRIRPQKNPRATGRKDQYLEMSEYRTLPASVRNVKRGTITLDEAADEIERHFPWINVHSSNDLIGYLRDRPRRAGMYRHGVP